MYVKFAIKAYFWLVSVIYYPPSATKPYFFEKLFNSIGKIPRNSD